MFLQTDAHNLEAAPKSDEPDEEVKDYAIDEFLQSNSDEDSGDVEKTAEEEGGDGGEVEDTAISGDDGDDGDDGDGREEDVDQTPTVVFGALDAYAGYKSSSDSGDAKMSDKRDDEMEVDVDDDDDCSRTSSSEMYHFTAFKFQQRICHRSIQQFEGPCPMLAMMNALLLQGRLRFDLAPGVPVLLSFETMIHNYLGTLLSQNFDFATLGRTLRTMKSGMYVNLRFQDVDMFDANCTAFQLFRAFNLPLFHTFMAPEYQKDSFEERTSNLEAAQRLRHQYEGLYSEKGIKRVYQKMQAGTVAVLFHRSHFWTIYKRSQDNVVYQLVTQANFVKEHVVWMTFNPRRAIFPSPPIFVDADFNASNGIRSNELIQFRSCEFINTL